MAWGGDVLAIYELAPVLEEAVGACREGDELERQAAQLYASTQDGAAWEPDRCTAPVRSCGPPLRREDPEGDADQVICRCVCGGCNHQGG